MTQTGATLTRDSSQARATRGSLRVVIVNYRTYALVETCARALMNSSVPPMEIVVVDNESDPDQLAGLQRSLPGIQFIANIGNEGYARACNQGSRGASMEFLLFINPDVTVERDCLRQCIRAASVDPAIGIVTCRLVRPDGSLDHACHRGLPTPSASLAYALRLNRVFPRSHTLARYTMSWLDPRTDHDVEACTGAFMLVRRSVLEGIGGWDERYWFYAEDLDLCLRIGQAGSRVRFVGTAMATHIKGASSHLRDRSSQLTAAERAHRRRIQAAIVESHRRFFQEHFERTARRPVAAAIRVMFAAQMLRVRLLGKLEGTFDRSI